MEYAHCIQARQATPEQALALFESLAPADVDFMFGAWKGEGFHTDHPLDGVLEAYHWHGKRFEDAETVHPLVFRTLWGSTLNVNPGLMVISPRLVERVGVPKAPALGRLFQCLIPLMRTGRPRARLRMTEYRGTSCATMIYDQLPILDVFRRIDDDTALGLMDLRGLSRPLFFVLRREQA